MLTINFKENEKKAIKNALKYGVENEKYPYMVGAMMVQLQSLKEELVNLSNDRDSFNKNELMDRLEPIIEKLEFETTDETK